jgi:hypothetical protein
MLKFTQRNDNIVKNFPYRWEIITKMFYGFWKNIWNGPLGFLEKLYNFCIINNDCVTLIDYIHTKWNSAYWNETLQWDIKNFIDSVVKSGNFSSEELLYIKEHVNLLTSELLEWWIILERDKIISKVSNLITPSQYKNLA